jgi:hypothetical protein
MLQRYSSAYCSTVSATKSAPLQFPADMIYSVVDFMFHGPAAANDPQGGYFIVQVREFYTSKIFPATSRDWLNSTKLSLKVADKGIASTQH